MELQFSRYDCEQNRHVMYIFENTYENRNNNEVSEFSIMAYTVSL